MLEGMYENIHCQETCPREVVPYTAIQNATRLSVDPTRSTIKSEYLNQLLSPYELSCIMKIPNLNEMKPYTSVKCSNNTTKLFLLQNF